LQEQSPEFKPQSHQKAKSFGQQKSEERARLEKETSKEIVITECI
jgi:hypothetical protein